MEQLYSQRVHIIPVGYEKDRVLTPIKILKAERVYLIIEKNLVNTDAKNSYNTIKAQLETEGITPITEKCDNIFDLFDLLLSFRTIIEKESRNQIFINVSSGSKIQAIAGMMASGIFSNQSISIQSYYVRPEDYQSEKGEKDESKQIGVGVKEIIPLPNYTIKVPKREQILAMQIIKDYEPVSKAKLIQELKSVGLIDGEIKDGSTPANHSQLNKRYLKNTDLNNFIEVEGEGKRSKISLTEEGHNLLRFLSYDL